MKSNIALIGFMGTGKTTAGELLAEKLGKDFIEIDELIAKKAGKPVSKIFEEEGEARFRELETKLTKKVAGMENVVISCGGGTALNRTNIDGVRKNAVVILLTASPEAILKRTSSDDGRPLLNASNRLEQIEDLLEFREPFYKSGADFVIDTTELQIDEVVDKITNLINRVST